MKRLKRKLSSLVLRVKRWLIEKLGGKLCSRSCDLYISRIEVVERLIPNPDKIRADVTLYGKPWSFQHDESEIRYEMSKRMEQQDRYQRIYTSLSHLQAIGQLGK